MAEAKVIAFMIENEYEVYTPFSDNAKYDILGFRDGKIYRVSVKYTSDQAPSKNWKVRLTNVSRRNNGLVKVDKFDSSFYDLLAVYIGPKDEVRLIDVKDFEATTELTIKY